MPGMPKVMLEDKYGYFGDQTMKDRVAFATHKHNKVKAEPLPIEPSGRSDTGWDKYFFFSNAAGSIGPTARKGRSRPAATGPCTFRTEAFSKEDLAIERKRIEALGPRTSYGESFSQFPRTTQAEYGPPGECHGSHGGMTAEQRHAASAPALEKLANIPDERIMAAHEFLDRVRPEGRVIRAGPMWPPPTAARPDPIQSRLALFRGVSRSIVDLNASDRKAPVSVHYIVGNR